HVRPRTEITARRPGTSPTAGGASSITRRWTDRDLPSAVLTQAHRPLRLALVLLLAQGLPLVELLLASHQRDLDLGPPLEEVQLERHDRAALLPGLAAELDDLVLVQQELALAARAVIRPRTLRVLGDVHVVQPGLTAGDLDPSLDEGGPAHAQRLDLGAGEREACLERVVDVVVVPGAPVAGDHLAGVGVRLGP